MDWKDRLTQEKSLFQIYETAKIAARSNFNNRATACCFVMFVGFLGVNSYFGEPITSSHAIVAGVREVSDIGFSFSTTILGFLISGFAIFVGISKPEILIVLAKTDRGSFGISELQFILFNFMLVFIHYIIYMIFCAFLKVVTFPDGPLPRAISLLYDFDRSAGWASISVIFALSLSWLVFSALLLKSFIWNIYQAMLIIILVEAEIEGK